MRNDIFELEQKKFKLPIQSSQVRSGLFEEDINIYHGTDAISSSGLRLFMKSTAKYLHYLKNGFTADTEALRIGSALHCMVLEPEKFNDLFVVAPEINRRTKEGKETWELFNEQNKDKTLLTYQQAALVTDMNKSIKNDVLSSELLMNTQCELSARVKLSNGLVVQCRPDAIKDNCIIDLKTCKDINKFPYEAKGHGYHIQAAFYYFILSSLYPDKWKEANFYFIAIEKTPPFEIKIFGIDQMTLEALVADSVKPALHNLKEWMNEYEYNPNIGKMRQEIEWLNLL